LTSTVSDELGDEAGVHGNSPPINEELMEDTYHLNLPEHESTSTPSSFSVFRLLNISTNEMERMKTKNSTRTPANPQ
jgi:hypothetical protein